VRRPYRLRAARDDIVSRAICARLLSCSVVAPTAIEKSDGSDVTTSIEFGSSCRFSLTTNVGVIERLHNVAIPLYCLHSRICMNHGAGMADPSKIQPCRAGRGAVHAHGRAVGPGCDARDFDLWGECSHLAFLFRGSAPKTPRADASKSGPIRAGRLRRPFGVCRAAAPWTT
jgi:hypothetical protein